MANPKQTEYSSQYLDNLSRTETDPPLVRRVLVGKTSGGGYQDLSVSDDGVFSLPGFNIPPHDYLSASYPNSTTEVYTYKTGGSGGTTVATITVIYTTSDKEFVSTVTKS